MSIEEKTPVITIDGPSGTGKGTLCHMLADYLNWNVLDSGCIYRVLAFAAIKMNIEINQIDKLVFLAHNLNVKFEMDPHLKSTVILDGVDVLQAIRSEQCGQHASKIGAIPEVREALLARQRAFAQSPGLVTDGRDMGTVVFPKAILKLYLDASIQTRAERRYFQLKESGNSVSLAEVINELAIRDERDAARSCAPLKPAPDAILVDTTGLTVTQVFKHVLNLLENQPYLLK